MKHFLTLVFLIVCAAQTINAQPYQSMFGSNVTEWHIISIDFNLQIQYDIWDAHKDTIENGELYKEIVSKPDGFALYLHEDLNAGKVFLKFYGNGADSVYMDYTLNKGDTVYYTVNTPKDNYSVVDSVYYSGGRKHIRLHGDWSYINPYEYIEGVGCTLGFQNRPDWLPADPPHPGLTCYYRNGILTYDTNDPYWKCSPFTEDVPSIEKPSIKLFPDPVTDELNISNATGKEICIYNLSGQAIYKANINIDKYSIDVHTWQAGLYFASLKNEAGIMTLKFVKQ